MAINLAIVDDRQINRTTVKEKISGYKEIELVLEAKDGNDFLQKLKENTQKPQVVLMDLEMPVMDGIEAIRRASAIYPDIKFIVLTVFEDNEKIFEAIKAGAGGYLLKEDSAVNIIDAITNVVEHNGIPMSPVIAQKAMELLRQTTLPALTPVAEKNETHNLTDRELDILRELSKGSNYKMIAEKLFISPLTVRKHVSNIYNKLHVNTPIQAINLIQKNNW
jgi:DNA-binding NarL/FixJ family response regulator